jgi:hypothetical protein
LSGSRDHRILEVGENEIEYRAHEKIHTFLEMPGVLPPMLMSQGISFGRGVSPCFRGVEDTPKFFFKEEDGAPL